MWRRTAESCAALLSNGTLLVKEGNLQANWNTEYVGTKGQFDGLWVVAVSVASDPVHGPLIGILLSNGAFLVKDGSLTANWNDEYNCPNSPSIAVASDAANGPLIGVVCQGNAYVKEGRLAAGWDVESIPRDVGGELHVYLASDPDNGPLIGVVDRTGALYVKEGSLGAGWNEEWDGFNGSVCSASLASDIATGPTIGIALCDGIEQVKSGSMTSAWVAEASDSASAPATQIAVASDQQNGPLVGELTNAPRSGANDTYYVKEGSLGASWY